MVSLALPDEAYQQWSTLARNRSVTVEELMALALGWLIDDEREFMAGLEQAEQELDAGHFHTHEEVRKMMDELLAKRAAA